MASHISTPPLDVPAGNVSVNVGIICNSTLTGIPMSRFAKPTLRGVEALYQVPSFSFFIQHPSGRRIMFDLGIRKDWENFAPIVAKRMAAGGWTADASKDVPEMLEEQGISLESIESVVWSHWHWDHVGDMTRMPQSTRLIVGPGFPKAMTPGYPANQNSPILESDYSGRQMSELEEFETRVAGLPAHDYFGDGSLYLLSTPGHAVGHLSALARTTSGSAKGEAEDTFILMGGDCCHHMSEMRPHSQSVLPRSVRYATTSALVPPPCHCDEAWTPASLEQGSTTPFSTISDHPNGASASSNPPEAVASIQKLQAFDTENGNVFFAIAHDRSLLDVVEMFPKLANDWKSKGWAERSRWTFLDELKE